MCDTYKYDPALSVGENKILAKLECQENNRQLGHCIVFDKNGRCNVPGLIDPQLARDEGIIVDEGNN